VLLHIPQLLPRFFTSGILYKAMEIFDEPLVFVDIETNGLNPVRGRVIEVAAIRVERGTITKEFTTLIDPGSELPRFITELTGITGDDVRQAPVFLQIADKLEEVLDGAIFVAHNVRFDYSFLKQEFKRIGRDFSPRQLCTVRLSRALYPEQRSHKLANLIERHNFTYTDRHRAYDDAHVLWQFLQHTQSNFTEDVLRTAIGKQLKQPSLPKNIDPELVKGLPDTAGVYIFEDGQGRPLYVGKSVHLKKRVLSHFNRDHEITSEFKIAQSVHNIRTVETGSELEALLLESQLVKELQPLHNKLLRQTNTLVIARQETGPSGHMTIQLEEAADISLEQTASVLAVYPRRGTAKASLEILQKTYDLCPKLLGLEKAKSSCFSYQLNKCKGACIDKERAADYNQRLTTAFDRLRIQQWPFSGAVTIQDVTSPLHSGIVVDQWCVLAHFRQEEGCDPTITPGSKKFDLDSYKILQSYLAQHQNRLKIQPVSPQDLQVFC